MWLLLSLCFSISSSSFPKCQIIGISRICLFHGLGNWLEMWRLRNRKNQARRRERLQKPLMNYDTSIILIGNKSGQGENKERRICASLIENKSCRQSFRFANWPTLKQTRQSCKRIGASSNAGFPLSSLSPSSASYLLCCSALTDLPSNVRSRQTSNRRRGRGQMDVQTDAWEVLWVMTRTCASWSIKLFKSVAQCTWAKDRGGMGERKGGTHWGPGHVFNVS